MKNTLKNNRSHTHKQALNIAHVTYFLMKYIFKILNIRKNTWATER